ncbi:MAG TPA: four helix bundle protein [Pirellulales bacterium]|nr:four helix bundle protein [Pirellulales bacterium]
MNEAQFKDRTKKVALRVIRLVEALPERRAADIIGRQLLRSGTSVGANYRAVCRAKSPKDMLAKLAIVEEEADESIYWLELLVESGLISKRRLGPLMDEMSQILAMVVASQKTRRRRAIQNPKSKIQN